LIRAALARRDTPYTGATGLDGPDLSCLVAASWNAPKLRLVGAPIFRHRAVTSAILLVTFPFHCEPHSTSEILNIFDFQRIEKLVLPSNRYSLPGLLVAYTIIP